jgi:ubiquinone/menaquinone biosynthesis C-methylase UbiE
MVAGSPVNDAQFGAMTELASVGSVARGGPAGGVSNCENGAMSTMRQDRRTRDDRHFDRWAGRYDRSWTQSLLFGPVQRSVVATLAPRLSRGARVLDLGCGTGRLLDRMGSAVSGSTPIGLDRSAGMAEQARRLRPDLRIERATAEALPHPDRSFDAVVSTVSFHHWSDKVGALAEVFRVLRPGGLFGLADISLDDVPDRPRVLWAPARRRMIDMPTLGEREHLLAAAGLRVLDALPTLHRRWIMLSVAERPAH